MHQARFAQCYFEGRPILGPFYQSQIGATIAPIVKAGKSPMIDVASGRYNVDSVLMVDPIGATAAFYSVSVRDGFLCFDVLWG